MNSRVEPERAEAYESALFTVWLPSGQVVLAVHEPPKGTIEDVRGTSLAVITAYNPGIERPSEADNEAANARLRRMLEARGIKYYAAIGENPDRSHREPSFAAVGITPETARAIGRVFRQDAVFYWDGERGDLIWC